MNDFIFVKSTDEHYIDAIFKILFRCGLNLAKKGMFHWIKPYSKQNIRKDCNLMSVILVKDSVSGDYTSTFQMDVRKDGNLYVRKIATDPKYEGLGIGRRNMQYMEDFAHKQGCSKLSLDVYKKSHRAVGFYKKLGFEIIGETKAHFFSEYIMEKVINLNQ